MTSPLKVKQKQKRKQNRRVKKVPLLLFLCADSKEIQNKGKNDIKKITNNQKRQNLLPIWRTGYTTCIFSVLKRSLSYLRAVCWEFLERWACTSFWNRDGRVILLNTREQTRRIISFLQVLKGKEKENTDDRLSTCFFLLCLERLTLGASFKKTLHLIWSWKVFYLIWGKAQSELQKNSGNISKSKQIAC